MTEQELFKCWNELSGPIQEITVVAKKYRAEGKLSAMGYIVGELMELIEDLKTGRF